jgi:hypothetical protein
VPLSAADFALPVGLKSIRFTPVEATFQLRHSSPLTWMTALGIFSQFPPPRQSAAYWFR